MKKELPNLFILVEGIDGGGKSTFAEYFSFYIKKYFKKTKGKSLSIMGQPFSKFKYGIESKNFIENGIENINPSLIEFYLKTNRNDFYKNVDVHNSGIVVCIRGILTDIATFKIIFGDYPNSDLGQNFKFDYIVLVDTPIAIADKRIESRNIDRTWREYPSYLTEFRDIFIKKSNLYAKNLIIIKNIEISSFKVDIEDFVKKIYHNS